MRSVKHLVWLGVKAKTGANQTAFILAGAAVVCGIIGTAFLVVLLYLYLARYYGALESALALALAFLAVSLVTALIAVIYRRRTAARARAEIAAVSKSVMADPRVLAAGVQIGRTLGWQKVVPLAILALVIAGWTRTSTRKSSHREKAGDGASSERARR